jgi:hypothetical protein
MGLFVCGSHEDDFSLGCTFLKAIEINWNKKQAHDYLWPEAKISIDQAQLKAMCLDANSLFDGTTLPSEPSPFKRAAAVGVLILKYDVLKVNDPVTWGPRIAKMIIQNIFSILVLCADGRETKMDILSWPSAHYEVEFIGLLRGIKNADNFDHDRVHERIVSVGLLLESCYYSQKSTCDLKAMNDDCLLRIKDKIQSDDILFDKDESLELASGLGIED